MSCMGFEINRCPNIVSIIREAQDLTPSIVKRTEDTLLRSFIFLLMQNLTIPGYIILHYEIGYDFHWMK